MLSRVLSAIVVISVPVVLLLLNVRLLMNDWFIRWNTPARISRPTFMG